MHLHFVLQLTKDRGLRCCGVCRLHVALQSSEEGIAGLQQAVHSLCLILDKVCKATSTAAWQQVLCPAALWTGDVRAS